MLEDLENSESVEHSPESVEVAEQNAETMEPDLEQGSANSPIENSQEKTTPQTPDQHMAQMAEKIDKLITQKQRLILCTLTQKIHNAYKKNWTREINDYSKLYIKLSHRRKRLSS